MTTTRCRAGDCTRPPRYTLTARAYGSTHPYIVNACPVHLNSLTIHVTDRTGEAPTQRTIRTAPAAPDTPDPLF